MLTIACSRMSIGLWHAPAPVAIVSPAVTQLQELRMRFKNARRFASVFTDPKPDTILVNGTKYQTDDWTNVTPSILQHLQSEA